MNVAAIDINKLQNYILMHQKATQYHVEIRKKHLNQIFSNQRRQFATTQHINPIKFKVSNDATQQSQQQLRANKQFIADSIRQAQIILQQASIQYCFETTLQALKGLQSLLTQLKNNQILNKTIKQLIIQSPRMLSNMIFMYRVSFQLKMQLTLSQEIAYYILNIIQKIISDEMFLDTIILEIKLVEGINEMVINGPKNKQFFCSVCYILANSMIYSEKVHKLVSQSDLIKNITAGYKEAYQQLQNPQQPFNLNYLFFINTYLKDLSKQMGNSLNKDQIVFIFCNTWKTFEFLTDQMAPAYHNNINDAILTIRILLEEQYSTIRQMAKIKQINYIGKLQYNRLFGILNMKSSWYQLQREILLIVDHLIYMDAYNETIIEMVRDHNMLLIAWSLCENHSNIILNIMANVATVKQLKIYLKALIPHILLRLFYKPCKQLYSILYNWFHAQDFTFNEGIDDQIISGMLRASHSQADNEQSLVQQGLIWQRLVQNGYRGNIPYHIMNSDLTSVQIIKQYFQR